MNQPSTPTGRASNSKLNFQSLSAAGDGKWQQMTREIKDLKQFMVDRQLQIGDLVV